MDQQSVAGYCLLGLAVLGVLVGCVGVYSLSLGNVSTFDIAYAWGAIFCALVFGIWGFVLLKKAPAEPNVMPPPSMESPSTMEPQGQAPPPPKM